MADEIIKMPLNYNGNEIIVSAKIRKKDDECIIFLHGLQSNKDLFADAFNRGVFKDKFLLSIDFVGFGDSSDPDHFNYDIADQANIVIALLKKLNITKCHIVGHSLGGMVGTLLLNKIPDKVLSCCNLEGNFCFEDCGASREVASNPSSAQTLNKAYYLTACSIVEWSKNEKLKEYWNRSNHPKTIVAGDNSPYASKAMASVLVSNSGHFMLRDNSEETYAHIERFIGSQIEKTSDGIIEGGRRV